MSTGIIYVVFGREFDVVASHCIAYSRKYTKLPIQVLTNIASNDRHAKWNEIENIHFTQVSMSDNENRVVKTLIHNYSIFENTLLLDADTIIQKADFDEKIKSYFESDCDLVLNYFISYPMQDNRFQNIYLRAYSQFECTGIMKVYNGAFIGFKKNNKTAQFFQMWNMLWSMFGKTREMPPLAAALNKMDLSIKSVERGFFSPDSRNDHSSVQHNYNDDFFTRIGLGKVDLPITPYGVDDYKFTQL